jgi:glycosidase
MPLLYEINTRCWLRELSAKAGQPVTLSSVPKTEFEAWERLGFTHIWLMGVWTAGPRARAEALRHEGLRKEFSAVLPDLRDEDVGGSPYAIAQYQVAAALGGEKGLQEFRRQLNAQGMKLLLDFVPNHLGLDHSWVRERPGLFVQSPGQAPDTFREETVSGLIWLAHGKDPYFPGWSDTVQLDYRLTATREAMTGLLLKVADRCDGVRCDMAMLVLNDVFAKTWQNFPAGKGPADADQEFWSAAISAVKAVHPDFLFLAEAYWGLESRLQGLGFEFTYDKTLYDRLISRDGQGVQQHLAGLHAVVLGKGAHFLENHDERRIASLIELAEHRAAALIIVTLPGLRFLHDGQLAGAERRIPVQLLRRPSEPEKPEIRSMYEQLLTTLPRTAFGPQAASRNSAITVRPPAPSWPGNPTSQNFVVLQAQTEPPAFDLVAVNLAPHRSQCFVPLTVPDLAAREWEMRDLLGDEYYVRAGDDLCKRGVYLDLPPHGAQLFHFQPKPETAK